MQNFSQVFVIRLVNSIDFRPIIESF